VERGIAFLRTAERTGGGVHRWRWRKQWPKRRMYWWSVLGT
jgi:hypothetical protein